jgi:hypothetical protein
MKEQSMTEVFDWGFNSLGGGSAYDQIRHIYYYGYDPWDSTDNFKSYITGVNTQTMNSTRIYGPFASFPHSIMQMIMLSNGNLLVIIHNYETSCDHLILVNTLTKHGAIIPLVEYEGLQIASRFALDQRHLKLYSIMRAPLHSQYYLVITDLKKFTYNCTQFNGAEMPLQMWVIP